MGGRRTARGTPGGRVSGGAERLPRPGERAERAGRDPGRAQPPRPGPHRSAPVEHRPRPPRPVVRAGSGDPRRTHRVACRTRRSRGRGPRRPALLRRRVRPGHRRRRAGARRVDPFRCTRGRAGATHHAGDAGGRRSPGHGDRRGMGTGGRRSGAAAPHPGRQGRRRDGAAARRGAADRAGRRRSRVPEYGPGVGSRSAGAQCRIAGHGVAAQAAAVHRRSRAGGGGVRAAEGARARGRPWRTGAPGRDGNPVAPLAGLPAGQRAATRGKSRRSGPSPAM